MRGLRICLLVGMMSLSMASSGDESSGADSVTVRIETDVGDIVAEVYPKKAPVSAGHFLELVSKGAFDNTTFHRAWRSDNSPPKIVTAFGVARIRPGMGLIQGGIADESKAARIEHETTRLTGLSHINGALSWARGGVGTAGTEFFICLGDWASYLDYGGALNDDDGQGYAVFGRVISGMDKVRAINQRRTPKQGADMYARQKLVHPVRIIRIVRLPTADSERHSPQAPFSSTDIQLKEADHDARR